MTIEEVAELAYGELVAAIHKRRDGTILPWRKMPPWRELTPDYATVVTEATRQAIRRDPAGHRSDAPQPPDVFDPAFRYAVDRHRHLVLVSEAYPAAVKPVSMFAPTTFLPADQIDQPRAIPAPVATVNDYKGLSLKEVLKRKRDEFAEQDEKNKHIIGEWLIAVAALFDQLEAWLKVADPEGRIKAERGTREVNEPGLGRYSIPDLNLRAFGIWIGAIPKAGVTIRTAKPMQPGADQRATGRVDITNGIRRYVLYRFPSGDNDEWFIHDIALDKGLQHLTAERFESVLLSYFR